MTWTRRKFIVASTTLCAGAVLVAHSVQRLLFRPANVRVRLLRSRDAVPSAAFERGVRAALGSASADMNALDMPGRFNPSQWREFSAFMRGGVVLGVVSEAEFVLVNELIRESGARLMYLGEHAVDGAGAARHMSRISLASGAIDTCLSRSPSAWPEALGFALGRVATRGWEPDAVMPELVSAHDVVLRSSSCVSFAFAV